MEAIFKLVWVGGWLGGRINWKYNHLSPQFGLGLSLAIHMIQNVNMTKYKQDKMQMRHNTNVAKCKCNKMRIRHNATEIANET